MMNKAKYTISIIDDEEDICFLLAGILKQEKHIVSVAHSLKEAEILIRKVKPTLVFLDNNLPDGLGVDFIEHLRKLLPGIKIIMISAFDGMQEREKAIEKGADSFIGKPFNKEHIQQVLQSI